MAPRLAHFGKPSAPSLQYLSGKLWAGPSRLVPHSWMGVSLLGREAPPSTSPRTALLREGPAPCPAPSPPRLIWPLGPPAGEAAGWQGRAMSHGAGLVRTTCSSGSTFGSRAGGGQQGASPSEGLLDPVYPRTHGALLKVAQMVREAGPQGRGLTEWPRKEGIRAREGARQAEPAGASRRGRGSAAPKLSWRKFSSPKVGCAAPADSELSPSPRPLLRTTHLRGPTLFQPPCRVASPASR